MGLAPLTLVVVVDDWLVVRDAHSQQILDHFRSAFLGVEDAGYGIQIYEDFELDAGTVRHDTSFRWMSL